MPIVMYASDFRILTGTQKFEECRSAKPPELPLKILWMRDSFNFAAAKNEKANYFKKITKTITLNKKCYLQFSRFPPLDDNINIRRFKS